MNFWEENFTPANMKSFGRRNVRKNKEIKNVEQYTALEISLELDGLDKKEVTYSGSRNYVRRPVKRMTTYMTIRTRIRPNKKHKERNANTEVVPQYSMKILEEFKDIHYLLYMRIQVRNYPTEVYFFLVKDVFHPKTSCLLSFYGM